ncbi:MAG: hypothetical protein JWO31_1690 [Phycisphaerales bacterium]|nr:hypothetical protein [Phycisphaerales bacterium]
MGLQHRARSWRAFGLAVVLTSCLASVSAAFGQADYDQPPINYTKATLADPVARLQRRLDAGNATLARDAEFGYLRAVLAALDVPVSSQALVFSKTSFQRTAIGPKNPRAIYFDDETYVGYVQDGDVLEVATTDPGVGSVFYTLDQREKAGRPRFGREGDNCLQCHAGSATRDVPGLLLRSVYPDPRGNPILSAGTKLTTHASPFDERFGGWYVTGRHGGYDAQHHRGNLIGRGRDDPAPSDPRAGADVTDLARLFDTSAYPASHSDLVALTVLSHQAEAHNLITRANYACKLALRDARVLNEALGRPADELTDGTRRRIEAPAEVLVQYLLFCDEAPLAAPISGSGPFAGEFAARGPRDKKGRSLREFDLATRTFRYPLSYLIYSAGFDGLHDLTKAYVYGRLYDVLTGKATDEAFARLSADDRRAIFEILADTKADLPAYWRAGK